MRGDLLDIQPDELKFVFELKKQTTCTVELHNKSDQYVAFKIKTTSPKKYSVRPNIGVMEPKSACDFTVTMQAQRVPPPDMMCKDKFLVQSTVVPAGTTEEQITSSMFSRDDGRYVEESKLRVILSSPPLSPVFSPVNGVDNAYPSDDNSMKKDHALHVVENFSPQQKVLEDIYSGEDFGVVTVNDMQDQKTRDSYVTNNEVQIALPVTGVVSKNNHPLVTAKTVDLEDKQNAEQKLKDISAGCTDVVSENHHPLVTAKNVDMEAVQKTEQKLRDFSTGCTGEVSENHDLLVTVKPVDLEATQNTEQISAGCAVHETMESKAHNVVQLVAGKTFDRESVEEAEESNFAEDVNAMKLQICQLKSMLNQAEVTMSKLKEEQLLNVQEREKFQKELAMLRSNRGSRKVQVGFPLLFVCMVALVSVVLGYFLHC